MLPDEIVNKIVMMSKPTYPWHKAYYRSLCRFIDNVDNRDFCCFYFMKNHYLHKRIKYDLIS